MNVNNMEKIAQLKEELIQIADAITPEFFFWLNVVIWSLLLVCGYLLMGFSQIFMIAIFVIIILIVVYQHRNPPIKENGHVFLIPIFALIYHFVFHSGVLFQDKFTEDKTALQQITDTIPSEYEHVRYGGGKHSTTHHYFTIGGVRLHCSDDNYDDCEKAYAYKDKTGTAFYADGLLYELQVDGQKIYEFNTQLTSFKDKRAKKINEMIVSLILFGIPSLLFFLLNKRVIRDIDKVTTEKNNKKDHQLNIKFINKETGDKDTINQLDNDKTNSGLVLKQQQHDEWALKQLKEQQIKSRIAGGGLAWRILFVSLAIETIILSMVSLAIKDFISVMVLWVLVFLFMYLIRLPRKNAKTEVDDYYEMLEYEALAELDEYALTGIYHYMTLVSWIVLYVLLPIGVLSFMFTLAYLHLGNFIVCIFMAFITLLMALLVYVVFNKAKNRRELMLS